MRYLLKNEGFPYKNIYSARRRVGRVFRHADGYYVGIIGPLTRKGATEHHAFNEVVAANCGFDSAAEMSERNRQVQRKNRVARDQANHALDQMLRGDFDALDQLLRRTK